MDPELILEKISNLAFAHLCASHPSVISIIRSLGLTDQTPRARRLIEKRALLLGVELPKRKGNKVHRDFSNADIFVINPPVGYATMRIRALTVLPRECWICHQGQVWNGKQLKMRLYHWNGNKQDCRKSNLRAICPNCESQEPTPKTRRKGL